MTDDFMTRMQSLAASLGATMTEADFGGGRVDPDALLAQGWIYNDLPRMDTRLFDLMLETFGKGEHHLLTHAMYRGGTVSRGQILLSPKARENLTAAKDHLLSKVAEFEANPLTPSSFTEN